MKTYRLVMDGILHLVQVRKDSNKPARTARVHKITGEPVAVLTETETRDEFIDRANNQRYRLNAANNVILGA